MSTETEFLKWLTRSEKTFIDNLNFALKAWQSFEFTLQKKYQIILNWIADELPSYSNDIPFTQLRVLFKYRAAPGLVKTDAKYKFVNSILKTIESIRSYETRQIAELLGDLLEFEILQDLYRYDNKIYGRIFGVLLRSYELYVQQNSIENSLNSELEFITKVLNDLKDKSKNTSNIIEFAKSYNATIFVPFVELLLTLRNSTNKNNKIDMFPELLILEEILYEKEDDKNLLSRSEEMPLHAQLLLLECWMINRRNVENFQNKLLKKFIIEPAGDAASISKTLKIATYILEVFHKHDINFMFDGKQGLQLIGKQIFSWVKDSRLSHFKEVLMLLCATLHYNPLILEENIFEITCWMIVNDKQDANGEQQLFEEYMQTLLDVFRKLSRAEKFVSNLLKSIKAWLQTNQIPLCQAKSKSNKRKSTTMNGHDESLAKIPKNHNHSVANPQEESNSKDLHYLDLVFRSLNHPQSGTKNVLHSRKSFEFLRKTWPSTSVGAAFSRIVTGLVSKPSVTIWKSLLYSLKTHLTNLEESGAAPLNENSLFFLDLHCALLCQYFCGCKLIEQADKFLQQIEEERQLTRDVLALFAKYLVKRDYDNRVMAAFLELTYHASVFDLVLLHYKPDGLVIDVEQISENLHGFISKKEWKKLEQQIVESGTSDTQFLLNRLNIQKKQVQFLLTAKPELNSNDTNLTLSKTDVLKYGNEVKQLEYLLEDESSRWFISALAPQDKCKITALMSNKVELFAVVEEDLQCVELLILDVVEKLAKCFASNRKSTVNSLILDFSIIRDNKLNANEFESLIQNCGKILFAAKTGGNDAVDELDYEEINWCFEALKQLPTAYISLERKWIVFIVLVAVYQDLNLLQREENAAKAYESLIDLISFGEHLTVFQYFAPDDILKVLSLKKCWTFYEYLFSSIKSGEKGTETFLKSLTQLLKDSQHQFNNDLCQLLVLTIEAISTISGPTSKTCKQYLHEFLEFYGNYVNNYFANLQSIDDNAKKHKKFVEKTLAGYPYYANSVLSRNKAKESPANNSKKGEEENENSENENEENTANNKKDKKNKKNKKKAPMELDEKQEQTKEPMAVSESFIRITKLYIGYSLDYKNAHAIRLMKIALSHRGQLQLSQAEIELVLSAYWKQLNEDLLQASQKIDERNAEYVIKLIIDNKTNEDFLLILKSLANRLQKPSSSSNEDYENILNLLTLIAKCSFSTIKGAIFNDHFKQITVAIALRLDRNEKQLFTNLKPVHDILRAQQALIENKMIPISLDTLDSVLSFLMDINIKKFIVDDTNIAEFHKLHMAMSDLAGALMKHRHLILMDRVAQFMHIFKDLLQAIVWYKSDKQKSITIKQNELEDLGDLALKLATLMSLTTIHSLHVKRVAPFILTFIINLMVDTKRPTTLHQKIKTHIESICYDLITICDHRVGGFILRCSNEAGRQLYESLVKDHAKYRKFKGKV